MKPEIICHIMSSVDGRLLPQRWTVPYGDTEAGELFKEYATIGSELATDAWMFGKGTTCEIFNEKFNGRVDRHPTPGTVYVAPRRSKRLFVTIDPEGDILFTSDTLRGDDIATIVGVNATADYLALLEQKGISYIVVADPTDPAEALELLHDRFGIRRISLQGGGIIDGAMLAARLLDELSVVIYPGIDGLSGSPSIFEYVGGKTEYPAAGQTLELKSLETRLGGLVWLRYKIHRT